MSSPSAASVCLSRTPQPLSPPSSFSMSSLPSRNCGSSWDGTQMSPCRPASTPSSPPRSSSTSPSSASFPSTSSPPSFSPRYALARRRRECLGLIESLRLSMGLSVKAITLLFCCVMMTLQYRAQQKQKAASDPPPPPALPFPHLFSSSSSLSPPTFYAVLQIPKTATAAQIKAAHRRLAIRYHPDKVLAAQSHPFPSPPLPPPCDVSNDRFIAIQEAYEVLSDAYERRRYDFALLTGTSSSYHRLSQAARAERQAAEEKAQPPDLSALYRRKRPAAFTATGPYKDGNSSASASTTASSAASSTASTPPVTSTHFKSSRSFSTLPFGGDSPAPTTATTGGTGSRTSSPHSQSPATSPCTPSSPLSSLSPASAADVPMAGRGTVRASSLSSLAARLKPTPHGSVMALLRWCSVLLLTFVCFPVRLLIALSIIARHRARQGKEEGGLSGRAGPKEVDGLGVEGRYWGGEGVGLSPATSVR